MRQALTIIQTVISLILIGLILIQAKGTGFGRSSGLGGSTSFTRRGLEKLIFKSTFAFALAFLVLSVLLLWF